ncbi:MAG: hydantoinase B/oxoprolinase family protein, partial [Alphaproteobacteria bacterium]
GSGGAGRHQGGEGLHREYRVLCQDMSVTSMFERRVIPPYGLQGGEDGEKFMVQVIKANGEKTELPGKANVRLNAGDVVVVDSCGGGGYGRPDKNN